MLTNMLEAKGIKFSMKDLSTLDQSKNLVFSLKNFDFFRELSSGHKGNPNLTNQAPIMFDSHQFKLK